jgi:predicted methyltransferase
MLSLFATAGEATFNEEKLQTILQQQSEAVQARYPSRNPLETLRFFGLKPGMTVMEVLPYSGWYTKIIAPYLGKNGHIIAGDYPVDMWQHFDWASEAYIQERVKDTAAFPEKIKQWVPTDTPAASAYTFGNMPASLNGTVDTVLFIRALHNLARFNKEHQFLDKSLNDAYRVLKPGGLVAVVQHQTIAKNADGGNGYLNYEELVASMAKAGFSLARESDINKNPKDQPGKDEYVWRLPPSLDVPEGNEALKQKYQAIGESNRMTLVFKK